MQRDSINGNEKNSKGHLSEDCGFPKKNGFELFLIFSNGQHDQKRSNPMSFRKKNEI